MSASWNFARRPFRDDRPVYAIAGGLLLFGAILLFVNLRVFTGFHRQVADTRDEIAALETRQREADDKAQAANAALSSYKLSALADESRELARIVVERRFSWTRLLARLERTLPPEVGLVSLSPSFEPSGEVGLPLQLIARKRESIVQTIAALAHDPAFTHVELRSETTPEPGTPDPIQFQLFTTYQPEERK